MSLLKASVTIFISLSLSSFILFIIVLVGLCIRSYEKVRFEGSYDIALNSVLGEYSKALKEIYDLFYIDASYLGEEPSIENIERHIWLYLDRNNASIFERLRSPWGRVTIKDTDITEYRTATAGYGSSVRQQAVRYVREKSGLSKYEEEVAEVADIDDLTPLCAGSTFLDDFSALMETIGDMELPEIYDPEERKMVKVALNNPADWVYGMSLCDIFYNTETDVSDVPDINIDTSVLCSNTLLSNAHSNSGFETVSREEFLVYLLDKMGSRKDVREGRVLTCELEYILFGKSSDYMNFKAAVQRIYECRLADNYRLALADSGLMNDAVSEASELEVCTYAPEFIEPVALSLVYACVYLETVSDMHLLLSGGRVPMNKASHGMNVSSVINMKKYYASGEEGLTYRQFLLAMLLLEDDLKITQRAMDMMELTVRYTTNNSDFCMDWCVERLRADIFYAGSLYENYRISRTYGYY